MCDPVTIAIAASAVLQANSQKQAGDAQKAIADRNAQIATLQGKDAINVGVQDTQQEQMKVAAIMGSQRAGDAANGVQLDSGTALSTAEDTAKTGALDEANIMLNARRQAWGYKVESGSYSLQGKYDQQAGDNNAMGSLLTGAGQAYKYQSAINQGTPTGQTFGGTP